MTEHTGKGKITVPISLILALVGGAASGGFTGDKTAEHRFTSLEVKVDMVVDKLNQQMEGYRIQNSEIARINRELREDMQKNLDRLDTRVDRLAELERRR